MTPESFPLTGDFALLREIKAGQVVEVLSDQILRLVIQRTDAPSPSSGGASAGVEWSAPEDGSYSITVIPYDTPFAGVLNIRDPEPLPE